jgi:uncharacterized cupredoxin-like copper-binding protein
MKFVLLVVALGLGLLVACGGGGTRTNVGVRLEEWSVAPSTEELPRGQVTFAVSSEGSREHELVVIKSDLTPEMLPVSGARVNESEVNVVRRMEPIGPGESGELSLSLTPGKYLLICNLSDPGQSSGHYQNGMVALLVVNPR